MTLQLLVPLHTFPDANADNIAIHATAVARHLEAELNLLVLAAQFPRAASPLGNLLVDVPGMVADARAKCRAHGQRLVKAVEEEAQTAQVGIRQSDVECIPSMFADRIADQARYHDLVLVGLGSTERTAQATAEAVVFGSGKPTLLVPENEPAESLDNVMIAWDGSRPAARAVSDARDFLARAKSIIIVSVTDEKQLADDSAGRRLAEYFERRGLSARATQLQGGARPVAETLQDHAREVGAGLVVMGGFGHSRVRDFVLGGATRGIIRNPRLPALLSH